MWFDHHVHLEHGPYTPHDYPQSWVEQYLETARRRNVAGIGIVEHAYRFEEARGLLPTPWADARCRFNLSRYTDWAGPLREQYPVALGLEMDYVPENEAAIRDFLARFPWDFVLGSVHFLGGFGLDVREMEAEYDRLGAEEVWRRYYETSIQAASSGLFDVITHPDLPKIFGHPRPPESFLRPLYQRFVTTLAENGVSLEINTAGVRRPVGEIYPHPTLLAMAHAAGVSITLASDAHEPENVGLYFPKAAELAMAAGFREAWGWSAGRRQAFDLTDG